MLKITMSFKVFVANKVFAAHKSDSIKSNNKSIEKSAKLKTRKLSKLKG